MSESELKRVAEMVASLKKSEPTKNGSMIENIKASLPTIGSIIGITVVATWAAAGQLNSIRSELNEIKITLQNGWRVPDQREWASQLKERNISLSVPDTDKVRREVNGK